ncbi:MAG: hypothetical protein DHS20C21_21610 [Gemmatimonadota bacterium]|nr:MAG: hypothetical protein DHS20C21_21610 [Gemmatimonadota bacterium]
MPGSYHWGILQETVRGIKSMSQGNLPQEDHRGEVTEILRQARLEQRSAAPDLLPLVYEEMRLVAHRLADGKGGRNAATLQPTAVVHEA